MNLLLLAALLTCSAATSLDELVKAMLVEAIMDKHAGTPVVAKASDLIAAQQGAIRASQLTRPLRAKSVRRKEAKKDVEVVEEVAKKDVEVVEEVAKKDVGVVEEVAKKDVEVVEEKVEEVANEAEKQEEEATKEVEVEEVVKEAKEVVEDVEVQNDSKQVVSDERETVRPIRFIRKATVHLRASHSMTSYGTVFFAQDEENAPVHVTGFLSHLRPGPHGLHVHSRGAIHETCANAGPHYNPYRRTHGGPEGEHRHIGDLGNVEAGTLGMAELNYFDSQLNLNGPLSIVGRSLVLHEKADDLGQGNHSSSHKTGDAGARLGCGVIGIAEEGRVEQRKE